MFLGNNSNNSNGKHFYGYVLVTFMRWLNSTTDGHEFLQTPGNSKGQKSPSELQSRKSQRVKCNYGINKSNYIISEKNSFVKIRLNKPHILISGIYFRIQTKALQLKSACSYWMHHLWIYELLHPEFYFFKWMNPNKSFHLGSYSHLN